jgi:uncharacterized protein
MRVIRIIRFVRTAGLLAAVSLLAACASAPSYQSEGAVNYKLTNIQTRASDLLDQAQDALEDPRYQLQLTAVMRLLQVGRTNEASQVMKKLFYSDMNVDQKGLYRILQAYLNLLTHQARLAMKQLEVLQPSVTRLSVNNQVLYFKLKSMAYARNHYHAASIEASLNALIRDPKTTQADKALLFRRLQTLSVSELNDLKQKSSDTRVNAWFDLALLAKQNQTAPLKLLDAIKAWQSDNPNSAALSLIAPDEQLQQIKNTQMPRQIALLLPLSGQYESMGKAVQNGFLNQYYLLRSGFSTPPVIKVYDTQSGDINDLYRRALDNGAELVVGPLLKGNVSQLIAKQDFSVPTILLNYTDQSLNNPAVMQFGLSPTQAAAQAADKAWQFGVNNVLMIVPASGWGDAVGGAFFARWQQLGGQIAAGLRLKPGHYSAQVRRVLSIDDSLAREQALENTLRTKLVFTPKKRSDANGIFMALDPRQARFIKPLLNFYFADELPVFSTSMVYNRFSAPGSNRDLNGVYFNDMPWVLSHQPDVAQLSAGLKRLWPTSFKKSNRFFALGIDAMRLSVTFRRLEILRNFGLEGMTGRLYLKPGQQIYRQLMWAQIKNGKANLL